MRANAAAALRARRRDRRRERRRAALDFWALQQRLHPAASRVAAARRARRRRASSRSTCSRSATRTHGAAVPRAARRARARARRRPRRRSTSRRSRATRRSPRAGSSASRAPGLDGVIAKDADEPYQPGKRVMAKVKHVRTADCVLAGYRLHKSRPDAVGSLLLGLYDDGDAPASQWADMFGGLLSVGVVGAFPTARRRELFAELQPLVCDARRAPVGRARASRRARARGARAAAGTPTRTCRSCRCGPSACSRSATTTWRARASATRRSSCAGAPTATRRSCGYAQLEQPVRFDLADVLAALRREVGAAGAGAEREAGAAARAAPADPAVDERGVAAHHGREHERAVRRDLRARERRVGDLRGERVGHARRGAQQRELEPAGAHRAAVARDAELDRQPARRAGPAAVLAARGGPALRLAQAQRAGRARDRLVADLRRHAQPLAPGRSARGSCTATSASPPVAASAADRAPAGRRARPAAPPRRRGRSPRCSPTRRTGGRDRRARAASRPARRPSPPWSGGRSGPAWSRSRRDSRGTVRQACQ